MSTNGSEITFGPGHDGDSEARAVAAEGAKINAALKGLDQPIRQVIGTMMRGLMVSAPGVPPHVLLNAIAWQTGNLMAGAIQGDLATVLSLRKGFKDAFADGISKSAIATPPMPGAATKLSG